MKPGILVTARWTRLGLGAFIGAVVLAGCGASGSGPSQAHPTAMVVNLSTAPATLDPAEQCGTYDFIITNSVYSQLTTYGTQPGPNGTTRVDYAKIEPSLAQSWTIGDGGLVYTFHLHSGVTFSDGTPVTSADVKYSFQRAITMNGCGAYFILDGHYSPPLIKSIATPTPLTVVITLNFPDAEVLSDWAQPAASIVEPSLVTAHGGVVANKVNTWMAGHVTNGSGPFVLSSYQPGVKAVLTANAHYFQPPKAHQIILNFISNAATLALDARDGEADITFGLPDSSVHSLSKVSGLRVVTDPTPLSEQLGFNNAVAPTNNLDFREALTYAVPYTQILNKVVFGYGQLFYGEFLPVMGAYNPAIQGARTYDLAKAKSLLAASGLKLPIHFTVVIDSGDEAAAQIAPILQNVWSQIGVDITISTLSPTNYTNVVEGHKDTAYIRLDGPGVPAAAYYLGYDVVCGIPFNLTQMCVPAIDHLLATAEKLPASQQQSYWNAIDKLWIADSPKIQLYDFYSPQVLSSRVTGFEYTDEIGGLANWSVS